MMINLLKQYGLVCLNNCQVFINIVIMYLPTYANSVSYN